MSLSKNTDALAPPSMRITNQKLKLIDSIQLNPGDPMEPEMHEQSAPARNHNASDWAKVQKESWSWKRLRYDSDLHNDMSTLPKHSDESQTRTEIQM